MNFWVFLVIVCYLKEDKSYFFKRYVVWVEFDLLYRMRDYFIDIIIRVDCFFIVMFIIMFMLNDVVC